jgi:hypothetical protein
MVHLNKNSNHVPSQRIEDVALNGQQNSNGLQGRDAGCLIPDVGSNNGMILNYPC